MCVGVGNSYRVCSDPLGLIDVLKHLRPASIQWEPTLPDYAKYDWNFAKLALLWILLTWPSGPMKT